LHHPLDLPCRPHPSHLFSRTADAGLYPGGRPPLSLSYAPEEVLTTNGENMSPVVDLSSELLIDRSQVRDPYVRLLLAASGQELARGSPWVAVE
jgi:hypothetical protein